MEQTENNATEGNAFAISTEINSYLTETAKWGKFLAIAGYIGMGFLILVGLFMMVGMSMLPNAGDTAFPGAIVGVVYLVIAVIYYFPVKYLHQFSLKMHEGMKSNSSHHITSGFENLKSLFKFMGIFTIVVFSIYGLVLLIAIPTILLLK